jgi:transcriptional regulator GlxA family with amidase domain
MYRIKEVQNAIGFIEDRLLENLSMDEIAKSVHSSSANFQRI